jgi:hypothetical protein
MDHFNLKPGINAQKMIPGTVQVGSGQQNHGPGPMAEPGGKLLKRFRQVNGFLADRHPFRQLCHP